MLNKTFQLSLFFALLLGFTFQAQAVDFNLAVAKSGDGNGTVSSDLGSIDCGVFCTAQYPENTPVKLTATPLTDSKFIKWTGSCSGTSNPTYVIMTEDKTCTAQFDLLPTPSYDLTVVKTAHGTVKSADEKINCGSDCSEQYDEGTQVVLIAEADAEASFKGWGGDCGSSLSLTMTVTMDMAKTCTATFKLLPIGLTVDKLGNGGGGVTSSPAGINCGVTCNAAFDVGTTVTLSATPDSDSEVLGWGGDCTALDEPENSATVTVNAASTCTVNFKPLPHTLTVTKLGGDGTVTGSHGGINCGDKCSGPIEEGTVVTLTAVPDPDYEFTHWTNHCSGTDKQTTVTMNAAKLCVAHFERLPQTLRVNKFGEGSVTSNLTGINCGDTCEAAYDYDSFVKLTAQPAAGYQLIGWHGDCAGLASSSTVKMDGAKTCEAYFAELPPDGHSNLSVVTMGGNGIVTSDPEAFNCESVCTLPYENDFTVILMVTADADSSFESWGGDCSGTDTFITVTLGKVSMTCTANFKLLPPTYNLIVTKTDTGGSGVVQSDLLGADGFGINCGADCIAAYPINTTVTLTAIPDFGSSFKGWSQHCSGTETSTTVTLEAAKTCTAIFELLPTYDITTTFGGDGFGTVTSSPAGVNCGANCTRYPQNAAVTLTAIPEASSNFISWGVDCSGIGNPITITLDRAKTCTANFLQLPKYEVTVTKTGDGSGTLERNPAGVANCGTDCQMHYQGTDVILTATAATGSTFTGWGGDCGSRTSPLTKTVNSKLACTANFDPLPTYGLTVKFAGSGNGTVKNKLADSSDLGTQCGIDCTTTYYQGETVALTATPYANSRFTGWTGECSGTGTAITVVMDKTKTCTASFEVLPPATLTVTKTGTGAGTVTAPTQIDCGGICSQEYTANTIVTLTAVANDDSTFTGWGGRCSGTGLSTTVTMDESKTCSASFTRLASPGNHHLAITQPTNGSVTSQPAGINCGATCTAEYPEGTVVTLIASPADGFTFTRWSGDCNSISDRTVVAMNTTQICAAHFASLPPAGHHNLTVIKTDNGNGTVISGPEGINCGDTCTAAYAAGTAVTLTATAEAFSRFVNWEGDCAGTNATTTVTVNATKNCFATIEKIPSTVQFSVNRVEVNEVVGVASLSVTRAGSSLGAVSVDYTTADGTALADSDYVAVTETLTWADGDSQLQTIQIPILLDSEPEEDETLEVTLTNISSGAQLGTNRQATLTIIDTPIGGSGIVQFSATHYAAHENNPAATISVDRLGGHSGAISVGYATSDETATAESDYQTTQGSLQWANGETQTKTFTVPLVDDARLETDETVTLTLSNPTNAQLGVNNKATLTILDSLGTPDTTTSPSILQFTQSSYQVDSEDIGSIMLTVSRTHGSHREVTVNYTTQDGSAKAEQDYVATTGVFKWGAGDMDSGKFVVPIVSDTVAEANETFTVNLSNPTGNASLGTIPTATVTILDSLGTPDTTTSPDSPGILQFAADNYQAAENSGSITITVKRTGGHRGVVEATYTTADDTASYRDYIATQNTLRWLEGDSRDKIFQISLYDDGLIEGDESFLLKLFNPTEGAVLGSNAEATVTITDDDATWVQFASDTYVVDENSKTATIRVSRVGGRIGEVSVAYDIAAECPSSTDNCATAEDYTLLNPNQRVLTWLSGESYDKTFTIVVHDDEEAEGNEVVPLVLSNITGNAQFGTPIAATLTIVDNDTGECASLSQIDCYWENDGNTLQDITIASRGTVVGGQLAGDIKNDGVIQDVTLLADTVISGEGIMRGDIRGVPESPAILSHVKVAADTTLTHVIITSGTVVDSRAVLKEGVLFEYNSLIPYMADLNELLGHISTVGLEMDALALTGDVLLNTSQTGILGAINGLYEFTSLRMGLRQNLNNGYLLLDVDAIHHAVLPVQVRQIWGSQTIKNQPLKPLGLTVDPSGEVTFITHTGREVVTLPVVQNPLVLREALISRFGLNEMNLQPTGNLKIPTSEGAYYMARPNLYSIDVPTGTPLGLDATVSPWLSNLVDVFLVFEASNDGQAPPDSSFPVVDSGDTGDASLSTGTASLRQQYMYPAAADPEALYALSEISDSYPALYNDGRVYAYTGRGVSKRPYKGVLDYLVTPGEPTGLPIAQINEIEDANGDNLIDYRIVYPNGDNQVMYQCAACFE